MNTMWLALAVKPLALVGMLYPGFLLRRALQQRMKDGKLKRLLLRRLN